MVVGAWWPTPVGEVVKMARIGRKASGRRPQDSLMDRIWITGEQTIKDDAKDTGLIWLGGGGGAE